jgi:DNA-binding SARP family transcriptional activator
MTGPATVTSTVLHLRLLGEPSACFDGREARIVNRKLLCLLGYLALAPGRRETRERLVGLLWSESDETRARGSLRQAMTAFRRVCGEQGFEGFSSDRIGLALDPARIRLDVREVLERVGPDDVHPALLETTDLPATLMRSCEDVDPAFRNWLSVQRESLRQRLLRGLEESLAAAGDAPGGGEDAARATLKLDPTHEAAARHLMRRRAAAGDAAGAIRVYNALYRVLEAEHDIEPSADTVALVARIKQGEAEPAPRVQGGSPPPPASARPRPSPLLLVEPFVHARGDPEAQLLLDGFRQRLIANLVRFREWRVAESLADDPAPQTAPAAEDRFRVRATAEPSEEGLALTVGIVEDPGGVFVWSDRFTLDRANWVERQGRLLRQVTVALNVNLSADRLRRISALPELEQSLHDRWLRGQRLIGRYEPEAWAEAERLFRQITRAAPDFAPAWSSLVLLRNSRHIAHAGLYRSRAEHWRTLATAQKAVELDPLDSRAHATLAWCLIFCGRWEAAFTSLDLALQLNDLDPWTVTSVAAARAFAGRRAEVEELADSVLETAETSETRRWSLLAGLRFVCGDYEGALEAAGRAGRVRVNVGAWRAAALAQLGREAEARLEAEQLQADLRARWCGPEPPDAREMVTWLLHIFPMRREADWRRLRDGLARAGLPTDHARFGFVPD